MNPSYIVVQAGGKGTRMKRLTKNKPKALVPIDNLPMLFHLFQKYPDSQYIVIGDYKFDVLERYLAAFAKVKYKLVCASGRWGTCAGIREALGMIPEGEPFLLIWSDLLLPRDFTLPDKPGNYVGVAKDFPCRWKFLNGKFEEKRSRSHGVAGLFYFAEKSSLKDVPDEGELVRWLAETNTKWLDTLPLYHVKEYGLLEEYEKHEPARCRPFNRVYVQNGLFVKEPLDAQGEMLAQREAAWYRHVQTQNFENIPRIVAYSPLKMELLTGGAVYEQYGLSRDEKYDILAQVIGCLKSVQSLEQVPADRVSFEQAYIGKTFQRLEKVQGLVPFAEDEYVTVNGRKCRNVFYRRDEIEKAVARYMPERFCLIHGDCTFSNIMLRKDGTPVLIDPRGYFGAMELYGDPAYDWAKLYYSIAGNYDQFNRKRFDLAINEHDVALSVRSNGWEDMEDVFFRLLEGEVMPRQVKLIHAIIWLSLTTYAWEDYDSICGAFYNGLFYLEEALHESVF